MPLKPLPYREVMRRLLRAGFVEHSQRGSHVKFVRMVSAGARVVIVPRHGREIPVGTLRSILHQAGMTPEEFARLG